MHKVLAALVAAACCGCFMWKGASEPGTAAVNSFDLSGASNGAGKAIEKRGGGFVTHAESAVAFTMNGKVRSFDATVSVDPKAPALRHLQKRPIKIVCKVWADGQVVWTSGELNEKSKPVRAHVDLTGRESVVLETVSSGIWTAFDAAFALWDGAAFAYDAGAVIEPVTDREATAQLGILTPPEKETPQFNGAEVWGVRPGHEVIFRVPVSGVRPMKFSAKGLPDGVTLDAKGVLRGVAPKAAGDYPVEVTAENARGRASRVITLKVGDTIALTPPMGWNSWNVWCYRLTAEHAMASALALEESGLGNHGWAYVNLDDWWEMNNSGCERVKMREKDFGREDVVGPARDAKGKIIPNRSFPDMKKLTDYIHSFGFKAGLYSSPGPVTCGLCEASYQHEMQDAESWADWGFDYVKYDWCSYDRVFQKELEKAGEKRPARAGVRHPGYEKPYRLMGDCLRAQKRDIVYSFCQYGMGKTEEWAREAGANCWRSWDDLKDTWPWMEAAVESRINAEYWKYNCPGFWADPDMMIIGQQYSFGFDHPTFLTPNEQYTHVSLWCMIGSPLLIGCDLTKLDAFTRNLLANDEVIAISQDTLGKVAKREVHDDAHSVWVRPLKNGDTAVAVVSRYPLARTFKVDLAKFGLGGEYRVRDCWRQADEANVCGTYSAEVLPHATHLIRLSRVNCSRCE